VGPLGPARLADAESHPHLDLARSLGWMLRCGSYTAGREPKATRPYFSGCCWILFCLLLVPAGDFTCCYLSWIHALANALRRVWVTYSRKAYIIKVPSGDPRRQPDHQTLSNRIPAARSFPFGDDDLPSGCANNSTFNPWGPGRLPFHSPGRANPLEIPSGPRDHPVKSRF